MGRCRLDNLFAYNDILKGAILLRPLIGRDKLDIIRLNEKIGLYGLTSKSSAGCKHNPQYPETHAKPNELKLAESRVDIDDLIKESLSNAEVLNF